MSKGNDSVIILRRNEIVEFVDVQVPYEEGAETKPAKNGKAKAGQSKKKPVKEDDLFETWSIDSPLEEFIDVQVPCDEPVHAKPLKPRSISPKNGKSKAAQARKKKPAKRRKS
jgi:hypothetical protein